MANTLASVPFIFLIALVSTVCVYFIANLRLGGFIYFVLCLFMSLVVVESLMMALAGVLSNFLSGIAAGAGVLGIFMIVCESAAPQRRARTALGGK